MGTIADKLAYLAETKRLIKNKINDVGGNMPPETPFRQYPNYITGGGPTPPTPGPIDPVEYYNTHRPADWLPMTPDEDMPENTIELLCELGDDDANFFAYTVQTAANNFTYSINGGTPVVVNGSTLQLQLKRSDYPEHLVANGNSQVMLTITASTPITTFTNYQNSSARNLTLYSSYVVELKENFNNVSVLRFGNSTNSTDSGSHQLKFATLLGDSEIPFGTGATATIFSNNYSLQAVVKCNHAIVGNCYRAFATCNSLVALPKLDFRRATTVEYIFFNCVSLHSVPEFNFYGIANVSNMFSGCKSLQSVPEFDLSASTNTSGMFSNCSSLQSVPEFDLSASTNTANMFSNCSSLIRASIDLSHTTSLSDAFYFCYQLKEVIFTGEFTNSVTASGASINVARSCMGRTGMVNMFNSLPDITGTSAAGAAITYTNTPAAVAGVLTADDKLIATSKGWTLNPA
jgi:hypothetical protein